jgi:site-specific DNA-methyltransferase (adenine-specific)
MWDKKFSSEVSFAQFELAWTSFKSPCKKFDKSPNDPNRIHPTQKSVQLYEWILTNYAEKGMTILDTHLGSGSSAIAAHYFGCDLVGLELDEKYFNLAKKRFEESTQQTTLFY